MVCLLKTYADAQLFFDDEHRNFEVEDLGVTMQFITDGTNWKVFREGLAEWRNRRGIKIVDDVNDDE